MCVIPITGPIPNLVRKDFMFLSVQQVLNVIDHQTSLIIILALSQQSRYPSVTKVYNARNYKNA
jgi:hypothetical protein